MKFIVFGILTGSLFTSSAMAADGDILKCSVSNFVSTPHHGKVEQHFIEMNKQKTFDIFETKDEFIVVGKSKEIEPFTNKYKILRDGTLGAFAIADSSISLNSFAISRSSAKNDKPINANMSLQSSYGINSWFLTCVKIN